MGQAVQQCARQPFAAQDFGPLFKRQISGDDQASTFIRPADDIEKKFRTGLGERDVTQLIQQENVQSLQLFVQPLQGPGFALFEQLRHQARGGHEADSLALGAGGEAQRTGEVRFAGSRIPDQ